MYEGTGTGTEGSRVQFLILKRHLLTLAVSRDLVSMEYSTRKILSAGSIVVALGRNNQKARACREFGADYSVNIKDKTNEQVSHEIKERNTW